MTETQQIRRIKIRVTALQLTGAAYDVLRTHKKEAVNIAAARSVILIAIALAFTWITTGEIFRDSSPEPDLESGNLPWVLLFGFCSTLVCGKIFERWTRSLLDIRPVSLLDCGALQPKAWPTWLLASIVWVLVFYLTLVSLGFLLISERPSKLLLIVIFLLASLTGGLAAARLLLQSSLLAARLSANPLITNPTLENWVPAGWAYAIATLPLALITFVLGKLSGFVGGWTAVTWQLIEPLNATMFTLLAGAIGAEVIKANMAAPRRTEPSCDSTGSQPIT